MENQIILYQSDTSVNTYVNFVFPLATRKIIKG